MLVEPRRGMADGAWCTRCNPSQRRRVDVGKRLANRPDYASRYPGGGENDKPLSGRSLGDARSDCVDNVGAIRESTDVGREAWVGSEMVEPKRASATPPLRIAPSRDDERSV